MLIICIIPAPTLSTALSSFIEDQVVLDGKVHVLYHTLPQLLKFLVLHLQLLVHILAQHTHLLRLHSILLPYAVLQEASHEQRQCFLLFLSLQPHFLGQLHQHLPALPQSLRLVLHDF